MPQLGKLGPDGEQSEGLCSVTSMCQTPEDQRDTRKPFCGSFALGDSVRLGSGEEWVSLPDDTRVLPR